MRKENRREKLRVFLIPISEVVATSVHPLMVTRLDQPFLRRPLYSQVADALLERIAKGRWKPGDAIPNEIDLALEMGVSSGTMRKALERLEANHLIVRKQGRGTFVLDQADADRNHRFDLLRLEDGKTIDAAVQALTQETGPATAKECARLALEAGETVLRSTCLKLHGGQPFMYETLVVAAKLFPDLQFEIGLDEAALTGLAQQHGIILGQAVEHLTLCEATNEVADALGIAAGTVILKLDLVVYALAGDPIAWRVGFSQLHEKSYVVTIA